MGEGPLAQMEGVTCPQGGPGQEGQPGGAGLGRQVQDEIIIRGPQAPDEGPLLGQGLVLPRAAPTSCGYGDCGQDGDAEGTGQEIDGGAGKGLLQRPDHGRGKDHVPDPLQSDQQDPARRSGKGGLHPLFHRGEPVEPVGSLAPEDFEEGLLDLLGHGAALAVPDLDVVDLRHRDDLGGRAGKEHLVGNVEAFPGEDLLGGSRCPCPGP